jgi:hypothetical protein
MESYRSAVPSPLCVWPWSGKQYVTRDTTMETVTVSDIYCKCTDASAFSWTLRNIATY